MIEESLTTLFKAKLKLANAIIDELPSSIQESMKKHKKDFLHSMIQLMKDELEEQKNNTDIKDKNKVRPIHVE